MSQTAIGINDEADSFESKPTPQTIIYLKKCTNAILEALLFLLSVVLLPFILLFAAVQWLFSDKTFLDQDEKHAEPIGNFTRNVIDVHEKAKKFVKLPGVIRTRLVIFSVAWIIVNLTVPGLKDKLVLGTKLWKWSILVVMITCGYTVINRENKFLLYVLCEKTGLMKKRNAVYYAKGMRRSVNLVVLWGSILLAWLFYFNTSRGIKRPFGNAASTTLSASAPSSAPFYQTDPNTVSETHVVWQLGTSTFVALAVGSVLWAIKSVVLLKWKADAIYSRFAGRIFNARSQIYFLGHICGWPRMGTFKPDGVTVNTHDTNEDHPPVSQVHPYPVSQASENPNSSLLATTDRSTDYTDQHSDKKNKTKKAKGILCIDEVDATCRRPPKKREEKDTTLYEIKKMSWFFVNLSRASSREDDGTFDVLKHCENINPGRAPHMCITEENLSSTFKMKENDAKNLYSHLENEHSSRPISYEEFEKYMVKAHTKCLTLGHTLLDAIEVAKHLNDVMNGILFAIVIIVWLLLTDVASTKILVVIASPFLAATFVFGETFKKTFEGVIFSFVSHPFDVGDLCTINNGTELLEVKCMSVRSTKFVVIGTREEARYPNSVLASLPIKNLKGEPDPSDCVELTLDSKYSKAMLDDLIKKIHKHFEEDNGNRYEKRPTIIIKEIGDSNVKMEIQYKHVMSIHETTHSQCFKKKREQNSELLWQLKQSINGENGSSASLVRIRAVPQQKSF